VSTWVRAVGLVGLATLGTSLASAATDVERLMALHEKVIRAHQQNCVELLLEDESTDYVVASRGEVSRPTIAERRARLGPYFERTTFEEYRGVAEPIVTISGDGTLGWVVVQVRVRGEQRGSDGKKQAIAFTSAWIELYKKLDDRWYRVGNVSNFKE
jgi:hypothetical protein